MKRLFTCLLAIIGGSACAKRGTPASQAHPHKAHHGGHAHAPRHEPDGHHGQGMTHRFDDAAAWTKVFDDPARDAWQKPQEVVALMALAPGMSVADVGAGTGYFLPHLAAAVGSTGTVWATDIEPDMVRFMEERAAKAGLAQVRTALATTEGGGLAAGSVDRILIVDVWHHIAPAARRGYAQGLVDALRAQGSIYVVDFSADATMGPPAAHRLTPAQIQADFAGTGVVATVLAETLPQQYVLRLQRP